MTGSPTQVVSDLLRIDFACRDCSERPPDIVVQVLHTQESFQQHARVHGLPQGDTENACHCGDGRPCKQKLRREHTFWRQQLPTSGTPRVPAKAREAQYPGSATTSESSSILKSQNPSSSVAGGGGTATPSQSLHGKRHPERTEFRRRVARTRFWSTRNRLLTQLGASN